jgi:hypothetical protein
MMKWNSGKQRTDVFSVIRHLYDGVLKAKKMPVDDYCGMVWINSMKNNSTDKTRQFLDGNSSGILANMDSAGTGPKSAYPTALYIELVCSRISHKVK